MLSVEEFARLSAEIAAGSPREEVLGRAGVTSKDWLKAQQDYLAKMAAEATSSGKETTGRYRAAFAARRRELEQGDPKSPGSVADAPSSPAPAPGPTAPLPELADRRGDRGEPMPSSVAAPGLAGRPELASRGWAERLDTARTVDDMDTTDETVDADFLVDRGLLRPLPFDPKAVPAAPPSSDGPRSSRPRRPSGATVALNMPPPSQASPLPFRAMGVSEPPPPPVPSAAPAVAAPSVRLHLDAFAALMARLIARPDEAHEAFASAGIDAALAPTESHAWLVRFSQDWQLLAHYYAMVQRELARTRGGQGA